MVYDIIHAQHIPLIQIKEKNVMSCTKIFSKASVLLMTSSLMSLGFGSSEGGGKDPLDGERSGDSGLHIIKATQANYNELFGRLYNTDNPTTSLTSEEFARTHLEFHTFFTAYPTETKEESAAKYLTWTLAELICNDESKTPAWKDYFYYFIINKDKMMSALELRDQSALTTPLSDNLDIIVPDEEILRAHALRDVIGQDEAVSSLTMDICDHFVALRRNKYIHENPAEATEKGWVTIPKKNILVIGESGSGKTKTFEVIAQHFKETNAGIKIIKLNTSGLVASGYRGGYNPTEIGNKLLDAALEILGQDIQDVTDMDIEDALQHVIVLLDEFDKIRITGNDDSGVTNSKVQNELLPYFDEYGKELLVEREVGHSKKRTVTINTKDVLFACMGAFSGLKERSQDEEYVVSTSEIINYGFLPEIVSRLPIMTTFKPHTKESLIRILKESRNSQIAQALTLLSDPSYNIMLKFDEKSYEAIAKKAITLKIGARSLVPIVDGIVKHIKRNKKQYQGTTLTITDKMVEQHAPKAPKQRQLSYFS